MIPRQHMFRAFLFAAEEEIRNNTNIRKGSYDSQGNLITRKRLRALARNIAKMEMRKVRQSQETE
jgi:hypothetical protein